MKAKIVKTTLIAVLLGLSLFLSAKIIKTNYKLVRADFLLHSKGKTQHFINSFIN